MSDNTSDPNNHLGSLQGQNQAPWTMHHEQCPCGYPPPFYLRTPEVHKQSTSESVQASTTSTSERSLHNLRGEPGMRSDNVIVPAKYEHRCHFMDMHQSRPPLYECLHAYSRSHSAHNHQGTGYNSAPYEMPTHETTQYEISSYFTKQQPQTSSSKTTSPIPTTQTKYRNPFISSPSPSPTPEPSTANTPIISNHPTPLTPQSPSSSLQTMNSSNDSLFSEETWDNLMKDPNLINMIQEIDDYYGPSDTSSSPKGSRDEQSRSSNDAPPATKSDEGSSQSHVLSQDMRSLEVEDGSYGSFGSGFGSGPESGSVSGSGNQQFGDGNGDVADNQIDPEHIMRICNFYIKLRPTPWGNKYLSTQQEESQCQHQNPISDGAVLNSRAAIDKDNGRKESNDMKLAAELNNVKMLMSQLDQSLTAVQNIIAEENMVERKSEH